MLSSQRIGMMKRMVSGSHPRSSTPSGKRLLVVCELAHLTKKNPAYKGKWKVLMIDNPAYHGVWAPRQIPNLEFFVLEKPNLEPIIAIAIVIWTMQDGILFDNILVTCNEGVVSEHRDTTWKPKFHMEKKKEKLVWDRSNIISAVGGIKVCHNWSISESC